MKRTHVNPNYRVNEYSFLCPIVFGMAMFVTVVMAVMPSEADTQGYDNPKATVVRYQ